MKSFLNACGVKDSLQLVIEGPGARGAELRRFHQPFAVIGRDPRADVLLDDPQVSRRHAYLQVIGGWVFWVDLDSRTGTRTEAGPRKSGWLADGWSLGIGPYGVRRAGGAPSDDDPDQQPPQDTPLAAQAYGREPLPNVAFEFLNGPSHSMFWPVHRVMSLIGSAKGCKFRLTDPSVSAFHASVLRSPSGLWIVDLRGGRSLTVNTLPVRSSLLVEGDILGIGRYRIRIRCRHRDQGLGNGMPDRGRETAMGRLPRPGGALHHSLPSPDRAAGAIAFGTAPDNPRSASAFLPVPIAPSASGTELVSSDAPSAARLNQPELADSVLVPLVNQFSLMQQQMFDQFQQAMGMLVQMFGTMHREQMDVIREELDRLHQLAEELRGLKGELSNRSGGSIEPAGDLAGAAAAIDRRLATVSTIPPPAAPAAPAHTPSAAPRPAPIEVPSAAVPPLFPSEGTPAHRQPLGTAPLVPPSFSNPLAAARLDQPRPGTGSPIRPDGTGAATPERDAVAWIHQRIMTIQHERESRWQKILKLLPGVS